MKRNKETNKKYTDLSFQSILYILEFKAVTNHPSYHMLPINGIRPGSVKQERYPFLSVLDWFGMFKLDKFRKIFQLYKHFYLPWMLGVYDHNVNLHRSQLLRYEENTTFGYFGVFRKNDKLICTAFEMLIPTKLDSIELVYSLYEFEGEFGPFVEFFLKNVRAKKLIINTNIEFKEEYLEEFSNEVILKKVEDHW